MNAKEYLLQYKRIMIRIEIAEKQLESIREERNSITITLDGMPRNTVVSDKTAKLATLLADIECEIIEMRSKAWSKKMEIIRTLDNVTDPLHHRLLILRYVECKKWEEIAVIMGYTYQWVAGSLHSNALQEVQKILNRRNNE